MTLLYQYRLRFLFAACILIFMGAMLKIDHYENANNSFIGGIANALIFILLQIFGEKHYANPAKKE